MSMTDQHTTGDVVTLSVDLQQTLVSLVEPGQPCVTVPPSSAHCGSAWVYEAVPSTSSVPTFSKHRGNTTLPLASTSPGFDSSSPVTFFWLKNQLTGKYLSAVYKDVTESGDTTSDGKGDVGSTLFTLGAAADTGQDALMCALVSLEAGQGAQANTVLVWLNAQDTMPKALCVDSGSAVRVYAFPPACFSVPGLGGYPCPMAWQACSATTGYCFDASLVKTAVSSSTTSYPTSALAFPNCSSRRLAGVFAAPSTLVAPVCNPAGTNTKSGAVGNTAADEAESTMWTTIMYISIGVFFLLFVLVATVLYYHTHRHVKAAVNAAVRTHVAHATA